jgi:hypothetical protein
MCFTDIDYPWTIGDYDYHAEPCVNLSRCLECWRDIPPGDLLWSVHQEEETDSWDVEQLEEDTPETFDAKICGACELTRFRIHLEELIAGCYESESWCPFGEVIDYCHDSGDGLATYEEGQAFLQWKLDRMAKP